MTGLFTIHGLCGEGLPFFGFPFCPRLTGETHSVSCLLPPPYWGAHNHTASLLRLVSPEQGYRRGRGKALQKGRYPSVCTRQGCVRCGRYGAWSSRLGGFDGSPELTGSGALGVRQGETGTEGNTGIVGTETPSEADSDSGSGPGGATWTLTAALERAQPSPANTTMKTFGPAEYGSSSRQNF